mgnify:CR=1 FL=1
MSGAVQKKSVNFYNSKRRTNRLKPAVVAGSSKLVEQEARRLRLIRFNPKLIKQLDLFIKEAS